MNFQLIFCLNAYLSLSWIWKAFKAQVCPHFSNITHQTHGRWKFVTRKHAINKLLRNNLVDVPCKLTIQDGRVCRVFGA
jgi:hypothetical protein